MQEKPVIPQCVGVIPDGNRRWARLHGKSVAEGHREGYRTFKKCLDWGIEAGIPCIVAYSLSTENWQREKDEVLGLMKLLRFILGSELEYYKKKGAKIRIIGEWSKFPSDIQTLFKRAEEETADGKKITLALAASYGGRAEILSAARKLVHAHTGTDTEAIDEEEFSKYMWTTALPDPDLVVRTGGEHRLSNFLPWQSVYSELFFVDTLWPDFSKEEFTNILDAFSKRERRRGK